MSRGQLVAVLLSGSVSVHAVDKLIWSDEFTTLDLAIWEHEITLGGGGNWEFEYYTNNRSNSYVQDGVLFLKPTLTADHIGEANLMSGYTMDLWGSSPADQCTGNAFYGCSRTSGPGGNIINPVQSARLRTTKSFSFKYGRVEVKAKLPKGDWLWPAIWMLPQAATYGQWPASGEIDIVESRGNLNYPANLGGGAETVGSTLHWGPFYGQDPYDKTHATYSLKDGKTFNDDFHIFGLIWTEDVIQTYVDEPSNVILNVPISETFWEKGGWNTSKLDNPWRSGSKNAPFDHNFSFVLNIAAGGTTGYWDDAATKPWDNKDTHAVNAFWNAHEAWYPTWAGDNAAMQIDYIRVYQTEPDTIIL